MFNKVMTGGACQAQSGQGGTLASNPFTNMIDTAITGDAQAQQRAGEGQIHQAQTLQQ